MCDVREDAKAPQRSRSNRPPSLRLVLGYRTHPGLNYSSGHGHKPAIYTYDSDGGKKPTHRNRDH